MQLRDKTEYLEYVEIQPPKTALFFGEYDDFNKDDVWTVYKQFRDYDKAIIPLASPDDHNFFSHFVDIIRIFDDNYQMEIEVYTSSDFAESIYRENWRLINVANSIKIVHNPVIVHIPFERRRKPFYDFVKGLLGDTAEVFEI